jgi:hypothetical protein
VVVGDVAGKKESEVFFLLFLGGTAGLTPRPKRTSAFFCPLDRPKQTKSARLRHKNGSAR